MLVKKQFTRGIRLVPDNVAFDGANGEIKVDLSSAKFQAYLGGASRNIVTEDQSAPLSNKSIDADTNTISNLEVDNLKAGVLDTDLTTVSGSDNTLPSAKAVKTYVDAGDAASSAALTAHLNDTVDAHDASAISNVPSGNLAATDVQNALNELQTDIDTRATSANLTAHINDTVDAHDASAISNVPAGNLAATDVQGALNELQTDIDTRVVGPASAVDNRVARFDGTTGKLIQNSVVTLDDSGNISGIANLTATDINATASLTASAVFQEQITDDTTTTGANATISPTTPIIRLSNASLISVDMISAPAFGKNVTLINQTGSNITINNNTGGTAANRILTGTKTNLLLKDEASILIKYDSTESRWMVSGINDSTGSTTSSSSLISNLGLAATVAANALTIAIKNSTGSDPSGADAVTVGFRSATAGTGQYTLVNITSALSTVISSGSTAGQISGVASDLYVYLINNSGTAEVAWSSSIFDEGDLVSTTAEGGAGAADSSTILYSTTARSNVPVRLVGRLRNTQATAGTWTSAPSQIALIPFDRAIAVAARGVNSAGTTYTSGSVAVLPYNVSKTIDTHNALNTTTGIFTVPISGNYQVDGSCLFASASWTTVNTFVEVIIYKNNAVYSRSSDAVIQTSCTINLGHSISDIVPCVKGDTLEIRILQNRGANTSLVADTTYNRGSFILVK